MSFWGKKPFEEEANPTNEPAPTVLNPSSVVAPTAQPTPSEPTKHLNPEDIIADRFGGKLRSVLGPGTVIQGKLSFDTPVRIDGKLSGEVFSTKALIVGASGVVDARLEVASLIVLGKVSGSVKATERIEVFAGGIVSADIQTASLVIDNGIFNGTCKMDGAGRVATLDERPANNKPKEADKKEANSSSKTARVDSTSVQPSL